MIKFIFILLLWIPHQLFSSPEDDIEKYTVINKITDNNDSGGVRMRYKQYHNDDLKHWINLLYIKSDNPYLKLEEVYTSTPEKNFVRSIFPLF